MPDMLAPKPFAHRGYYSQSMPLPPAQSPKSNANKQRRPSPLAVVFEGVIGAALAIASMVGLWLTLRHELPQVGSLWDVLTMLVHLSGWIALIVVGVAMATRHRMDSNNN